MKAPDKIYLSVDKNEDWDYAMWTTKSPQEQKFSELDKHEEYIRKDALLEWVRKMRIETPVLARGTPAFPCGRIAGRTEILNELIERLNPM